MLPNRTFDFYRLGTNLFKTIKLQQTIISSREIKSMKKIFRQRLPKYKVKLDQLPSLTKLLTHQQTDNNIKLESLDELRLAKLNTYKQYLPINSKPILLEALFSPKNDIHDLLTIIDANLDTMTSFYIGLSFEALDDMMRSGQCDKSTVTVSPELKRLCTKAMYKVRFFEADELLKLLKCLSTLGMPEDTILVQAALQMTRHLINDFNLDELDALAECLETFKITDNSNKSLLLVLKKAIPLVQKNQIEEKQFTRLEDTCTNVPKEC